MLVIREAQIEALSHVALTSLIRRLIQNVEQDFPEQTKQLDPQEIREAVAFGCRNAMRYGLDNQKDLATYVYLMFTFGWHFDTNPAFPWAAEYLSLVRSDAQAFQRLVTGLGQFEHAGEGLKGAVNQPLS